MESSIPRFLVYPILTSRMRPREQWWDLRKLVSPWGYSYTAFLLLLEGDPFLRDQSDDVEKLILSVKFSGTQALDESVIGNNVRASRGGILGLKPERVRHQSRQ